MLLTGMLVGMKALFVGREPRDRDDNKEMLPITNFALYGAVEGGTLVTLCKGPCVKDSGGRRGTCQSHARVRSREGEEPHLFLCFLSLSFFAAHSSS